MSKHFGRTADIVRRGLVFISGKGGVGKTSVSRAIALSLSKGGARTLWATFEDPLEPSTSIRQVAPNLWHLNCEATAAFEEYAGMKIGVPGLTRIFLQNKLMRYLAKAAPGIHELVLLGKVWYERQNFDHVVVDMPSTGYGLAMFQSATNFSKLFKGGPIHRDAMAMIETFKDPKITGQLIVSLPEEMPLRESLELGDFLHELFPGNDCAYLVNRTFPQVGDKPIKENSQTPLAEDAHDYALRRSSLERHNLRIWDGLKFDELGLVSPENQAIDVVALALSAELARKALIQ
jgi:anion-transporting  ArsA/GET3 family ATPase